jgi:hypothetical protein
MGRWVSEMACRSSECLHRTRRSDSDSQLASLTPGSQNDAIKVSLSARKIGGSNNVLCGDDEELRRTNGGNTERRHIVDGHDRTCPV